jgi:D-arginine dehydrogenase
MADFLVIGGGVAGASAAYFLAEHGQVTLIERESACGYHTTGRSAALYTDAYGNAAIRALTVASRPFFENPPRGFTEHPLLLPRGEMIVAPKGEDATIEKALAEGTRFAPMMRELRGDEALDLCPVLDQNWLGRALHNPASMDMDVHAIHNGYLKGLRARGGTVTTDAELLGLERRDGTWHLRTKAGAMAAPIVVNAAGAWADVVGRMAGTRPIGLVPKRRTAFTFDPPAEFATTDWPMVIDVHETLYFKPEAGRLLVSPADETPMDPCDCQPDEMDVALAAARFETATSLRIKRVTHKWAGLRSFVKDKTPVVGFAADVEGFLWLAGQGGYGIMTSPAMGRIAASLATGREIPSDIAVRASDLSPGRLGQPPSETPTRRPMA